MAIRNKKTKEYIKLNLDSVFIDRHGVHVSYEIYKNAKHRHDVKTKNEEIERFFTSLNENINNLLKNVVEYELEHPNENVENFPQEVKDKISQYESLIRDRNRIDKMISSSDAQEKLENEDFLIKQLKLNKDLITKPIEQSVVIGKYSGNYRQQRFNHEDMYKELKKIFKKEEYEDC